MSNPSSRIVDQVPLHYREYAQNFILFIQKYNDWLYRRTGLSLQEVADLRDDTSWIQDDMDSFVSTGMLKYVSANTVDDAIIQTGEYRNPGALAASMADNFLMEEQLEEFTTADDEFFTGSDDRQLDTPRLYQEIVNSWLSSMGTTPVVSDKMLGNAVDQVLMVSLMKHIHGIKGTEQSIKLFFNLYFNEDVEIYIPKFDIAIIDGGWTLDHKVGSHIRDDFYYNEYSYVIRVQDEVSKYQYLFDNVYLNTVHPAGFKVFLEQQ